LAVGFLGYWFLVAFCLENASERPREERVGSLTIEISLLNMDAEMFTEQVGSAGESAGGAKRTEILLILRF
jgi:hypothetical protein